MRPAGLKPADLSSGEHVRWAHRQECLCSEQRRAQLPSIRAWTYQRDLTFSCSGSRVRQRTDSSRGESAAKKKHTTRVPLQKDCTAGRLTKIYLRSLTKLGVNIQLVGSSPTIRSEHYKNVMLFLVDVIYALPQNPRTLLSELEPNDS